MLNDIDASALARAIDRARRDPRLAAQLDEMLKAQALAGGREVCRL